MSLYISSAILTDGIYRLYIYSSPCVPQAHQQTFKDLLQSLVKLLQCSYVQDNDNDEIRTEIDKCIKLMHKICKGGGGMS